MVKISIIMPIYNVETFIDASIKSVLAQDFKDFELLIINDGSTDGSMQIVREHMGNDARIKLFSQKNKGISAARNKGLDVASGDYIYFIDSDDCMAHDALTVLYNTAIQTSSDIVAAGYTSVTEHDISRSHTVQNFSDTSIRVLSAEEALIASLYEDAVTLYVWGKLIRKDVFDTIRFPSNMVFEDTATMYKVLASANNIVVHSASLYFYLRRVGSISNSKFTLARMHHLVFSREILAYVQQQHPKAIPAAEYYLFMAAFFIYAKLLDENLTKLYKHEFEQAEAIVARYSKTVSRNKRARRDVRTFAHIAAVDEHLLKAIISAKRVMKKLVKTNHGLFSIRTHRRHYV